MLELMQTKNQQRRKLRLYTCSILAVVALMILLAIAIPTVATAQRSKMTTQDKFLTVYGQKIHYVDVGSGPVVILLHNLGGDLSDWDKNRDVLSQKYRVVAFDQVGAGQSDKPFINYRPATWVNFLEGVYKELKINSASLVGHSMGGVVAASFALAHPEKVERLVMLDAGYGYAIPEVFDPHQFGHVPGTLQLLNPSTLEQMQQSLALAFYDQKTYVSDAAIDKAFAGSMLGAYAQQRFIESFIRHEDVLDNKLGGIRQPTLIIWGREDGWTPVALGERFERDISGSKLLVIDHCGHFANVEQADQFNAAVTKFLSDANDRTKS